MGREWEVGQKKREIFFSFYGWGVLAQDLDRTSTASSQSSQGGNSDLVPISSFYHKTVFLPFITCSIYINNQ